MSGVKNGVRWWLVTLSVVTATLCVGGTAIARNTNERVCLRPVRSVPLGWSPPVIDGTVVNDLGWTAAWRFQRNDGTTSPEGQANVDAAFQIISDPEWIYFSAEVFDDVSLDNADRVLLGFDVSASNRELWDITARGSVNPSTPDIQRYRWNGTAWAPQPLPVGVQVAAASVGTNPFAWSIEIKIPRGGAGLVLPNVGEFGVYMNAMRIWQTNTLNDAVEFYWPTAPGYQAGDLTSVPSVDLWGTGSFSATACGGLWFTPADISATHANCTTHCSDRTYIAYDRVNNLHVRVHNDTVDLNGAGVTATNVKANFRIANFGLANVWQTLPASVTQPVIPSIAAASFADGISGDWTPGVIYNTPQTNHQCILVELEGAGNLTFRNKSEWTNMSVGQASKFDGNAELNAKGFPPPKGGGGTQEFVISSEAHTAFRRADDGDPLPREIVEELVYVFKGYRVTGDTIEINKRRYRILEATPGFGYRVQHRAAVDEAAAVTRALNSKDKRLMPKTSPERWKLAPGGLTPLKFEPGTAADGKPMAALGSNFQLYTVKVPVDGKLNMQISVASPEDRTAPGPKPGSGCGSSTGSGSNTTPSKVGALGMFVAVGAVVFRRRRRR